MGPFGFYCVRDAGRGPSNITARAFTLRTLLYGDDNLDFTENKRIINETLRFINDSNRFA